MSDSFSPAVRQRLASAKGEKSTGGSKPVKLGRVRTRIAGSRGFLRIVAQEQRPPVVTIRQVYEHDEELHVLSTWKSVGDALCGDPEHPNPDARGLGMKRRPGGREIIADAENVALAVRCLEEAGWSPLGIAQLVGKESVAAFEDWFAGLPSREEALAGLAGRPRPTEAAGTPAEEPKTPDKPEQTRLAKEDRREPEAEDAAAVLALNQRQQSKPVPKEELDAVMQQVGEE
jgi:hypothetical protein